MVWKLVTDPGEFFEARSERVPALQSVRVVVLVALTFALSPLAIQESVSGSSLIAGGVLTGSLIEFVTAFVLWLLLAAGVFAVARVLGERIEFSTVLAAVGWGLLPLALAGVVRAGGYFLALGDHTFPQEAVEMAADRPNGLEIFNPGATYTEWGLYQETTNAAAEDPVFLVAMLVFLACVAWSGHLWRTALPHYGGVEEDNAVISAAVPAALYALWLLVGLL